ncbi:MAG TPA: histidine kinase [Microlunatus sp.]|nr:histidine kinase [Microlunatus sp.]
MLWAVVVACIAVVTASLVLALASEHLGLPGLRAFLIAWIVVPYVVSGLIAWWRRPASRLGPLMIVTGFAMAVTPLQWSEQPVLYSVGNLLDMLPAALFLHVFLAFPTGRLTTRPERIVVGACYLATLGLQLVKILLGVNPANMFGGWSLPAVGAAVERFQLSLVAGLLLAGTVLLSIRRRGHRRVVRRPAALVVDAFSLALVMLALLYLAGLGSWSSFEIIRLVTFAALGLAPIAFLLALLDARLARGEVAGLVVELGADPTADLQAPLARALRDPTFQLAYWLPEFGAWADQNGAPIELPDTDPRRVVRMIDRGDEPMAALVFDRALEEERELVDGVAAAAGIALENGRLRADLRARLQELKGSRIRVLEASRQERRRLERNLHDGAQQRLVALSLELGLLDQRADDDPELRTRLRRAKAEVSESLEELRDVARGIYPAVLAAHGLEVALESLISRAQVPVTLTVDITQRPAEPIEVAAYYLVSEALTNIDKHARATSARVLVRGDGSCLLIDVCDDGVGVADPTGGSGLRGLADRVEALGGRLTVGAPASGVGTNLHAEIPWS